MARVPDTRAIFSGHAGFGSSFHMKLLTFLILTLAITTAVTSAASATSTPADDAAYRQVSLERAGKIVDTLGIADAARASRVRETIAQQYRDLRDIHDARDAQLAALEAADAADRESVSNAVRIESELKLFRLHYAFLGRLAAELTLEQIDAVKNGLTYGVLPNTYRTYLDLHPNLTDDEKRQVLAWLTEAREYAMDAGSSEAKHGWFGKYKGRINNFLAAAGYDAKQAEKDLLERRKAESAAKNNG